MKSKRAQKELEKLENFYPFSGWIAPSDTYRIAEIAEREAEERMRRKAAKAFKFACTDNYGGGSAGQMTIIMSNAAANALK